MVRNLFLTTLCALAFCPAFAQTSTTEEKVEYSEDKYKVETNRFWSNWFISAGGGAQILAIMTNRSHLASVWLLHWILLWANGLLPGLVCV